jgi:hypothetical protein
MARREVWEVWLWSWAGWGERRGEGARRLKKKSHHLLKLCKEGRKQGDRDREGRDSISGIPIWFGEEREGKRKKREEKLQS